jgi:hypothetical protein
MNEEEEVIPATTDTLLAQLLILFPIAIASG